MPETRITLTEDQVDDLRELLHYTEILEDWLLHADDLVVTELADFAFHGHFHPASAVVWLTEDIGHLGCRLRQALHHGDSEINKLAAAPKVQTAAEAGTSATAFPRDGLDTSSPLGNQ